ncbi:MAG: 5'-nucleotidase C-terminal domain-containing protein [Chloroflexi bacterium]|nr:5'-nucleotidase C-terminal domain-containing protein [Chloroflexota bacterium]
MKTRRQSLLVLLIALMTLVSATGAGAAAPQQETIDIQILNVSDWHGQLDPLVVGTAQVGGAAVLSAYFQADRLANPNTITLTAGDAFGATPPISGFFGDVPTIEAMNLMGFQVDTLGNHNFDGGIAHLQSLIDIADFQYVSANLENRDDNLTGVEDFKIFDVAGVKVAIIGLTNPEAPTLVFPGSFGTSTPTDPAKAALKARNAAKDAGAELVIVICHMGVTGFNPDGSPYGPLIDLAKAVNKDNNKSQKIDVIIGDHTDIQFSGIINGALVYENRSKGLTYAKAKLTVNANNHKLVDQSVQFVTPFAATITADPAVAALVQSYRTQLTPILGTVIGSSTVEVLRTDSCGNSNGRLCESLVGNVTADAMREHYGTDFAITNSGGLRNRLTCPTAGGGDGFCPVYIAPPYKITRGQVLAVLPFGNVAVTLSVNGAELKSMLENGVSSMPGANGRFPQVSGLCFTYNIQATAGNRITGAVRQAEDGSCTGDPVDLTSAGTYTIAMNDFMANGGDGYPNFANRMVTREILDQVLADYITAAGTISPSIQGRIVCTTTGVTACPVVQP